MKGVIYQRRIRAGEDRIHVTLTREINGWALWKNTEKPSEWDETTDELLHFEKVSKERAIENAVLCVRAIEHENGQKERLP